MPPPDRLDVSVCDSALSPVARLRAANASAEALRRPLSGAACGDLCALLVTQVTEIRLKFSLRCVLI